ncbi:thermostable hemolysin [Marinobacter caseinilyticus]|uniref:thermostable hemolysin n=1 Tax=Marinobacter caseinilyticus TaxID=2692195 RepID=UPI00140BAD3C|nr:thermostable hemolysin [Marinobacter caseinilyticus]
MPFILDVSAASGVRDVARVGGHTLYSVRPEDNAWGSVEAFIRNRFWQAFAAVPSIQVPELVVLCDDRHVMLAAVGLQLAGPAPLFVENYLGQPVEQAMAPRVVADRSLIVEIAHLAGVQGGISRLLFPMLTVLLHDQGIQWVTFTGTRQLRVSFQRLGLTAHSLGVADPDRIPGGAEAWGHYYHHQPEVLIAHVPSGYRVLADKGVLSRVFPQSRDGDAHELSA